MFMRSHVRRVAALSNEACIRPLSTVCVTLLRAVCFIVVLALTAVQAGVRLSTNTDTLTRLDQSDFGTNTKCFAHDFWS